MLFILTPDEPENLILATSELVQGRMPPPPASEPPDFDRLRATVTRHGCELLL